MLGKVLIVVVVLAAIAGVIGVSFLLFLAPQAEEENLFVIVSDAKSSSFMQGVNIEVYDDSSNLTASGLTGNDGVFSLALKPGTYEVRVVSAGYPQQERTVSITSGQKAITEISMLKVPAGCVEQWTCASWSECVDGVQTTTCSDSNECGTSTNKPSERRGCIPKCASNADCNDGNPCTTDICSNSICVRDPVKQCSTGDLCCPVDCDYSSDQDCPNVGECAQDSDCTEGGNCSVPKCLGSICYYNTLTTCLHGDGCCPGACEYSTDNDCAKPASTSCQSASDCFDWKDCTVDSCVSNSCFNTQITQCVGGDNCCPSGCSFTSDSDCDQCAIDADCNDDDTCTQNICSEDTTVHALRCVYMPISQCSGLTLDGCCPGACLYSSDRDCPVDKCTGPQDCDDNNGCTIDTCEQVGSLLKCVHVDATCGLQTDGCCPSSCSGNSESPNFDVDCPWE